MKKISYLLISIYVVSLLCVCSVATSEENLQLRILQIKRSPFEPQTPKEESIQQKPLPAESERQTKLTKPVKPPIQEPNERTSSRSKETFNSILPKPTTSPEKAPIPPLPSVTITGIIWDSDKPQAIINNQIINVGDTLKGMKIINIYKTGIEVEFYEKSFTLHP